MENMDKMKNLGPNGNSSPHPINGSTPSIHEYQPTLVESNQLAKIWARRAADLAKPPPVKTEGSTHDLLVFRLADEQYGIKVNHVVEIYPPEQITPVPRTPSFVVGVFSARGRLLSVVDLRAFFGLSNIDLSETSKIIVVAGDTTKQKGGNGRFEVGLLADEVEDVITIFEDELEPTLSNQIGGRADHTLGITANMLVVLNLDALLQNTRLIVHEDV